MLVETNTRFGSRMSHCYLSYNLRGLHVISLRDKNFDALWSFSQRMLLTQFYIALLSYLTFLRYIL